MISLAGLVSGEDLRPEEIAAQSEPLPGPIEKEKVAGPSRWRCRTDLADDDFETPWFERNPDFVEPEDTIVPSERTCGGCQKKFISVPLVAHFKQLGVPLFCEECEERQAAFHQACRLAVRIGIPRKPIYEKGKARTWENITGFKFLLTTPLRK